MSALYTLCYPRLSSGDAEFVRRFRQEHDLPFRDVVEPHFTMVFGISESDVDVVTYAKHVRSVVESQRPIRFVCRYAMLMNDDSNDNYYVLLVPDEGGSEISRLHDRLYTGPFALFLRMDRPYTPHIGIATIPDCNKIKSLCDDLNSQGLSIVGSLEDAVVCSYDGKKIRDLETISFSV